MSAEDLIVPTRKQWDLIRCPANEILWGGAAGGGKSLGILLDWNAHHAQYGSAAAGLLLRRTNPQLEEILRMAKMMFAKLPGAPTWNDKQRQFNYPDSAFLRLGYLDTYDDVFNYVGHAFTWRGQDETTAWGTDDEYHMLNTRMRSTKGVPIRVVNTTNPGGPGHQWVMKRWKIDEHPGGYVPITTYSDVKRGVVLEKAECDPSWDRLGDDALPEGIIRWTRMFIPSRLEDNPHLDKDGRYRAQLMTKDKRTRAMLLEGRWDVVEGAFFAEWDPDAHVCQPFEIPRSWRRFVAMDWGTWSPYCVLWLAESPYGEVYVYRELYGMGEKPNQGVNEPPTVVADKIKRIEKMSEEYVHERYLDDSAWKGERAGEVTTAQQFATAGVPFQPARRFNKAAAILNLKDWLKVVNGKSRLTVFNTCRNLIRTLPTLQIDKNNPDQYDTKAEDHCVTGDTRILTDWGYLEIGMLADMSVADGFFVWTPAGPRLAHSPRKTGTRPVLRAELSNGETVSATPEHKFLVAGRGFVELTDIHTGDIMVYGGDQYVGEFCSCYRTHDPGFCRDSLLSVRSLLPAEGVAPAPDRLGKRKRANPSRVPCPPQGWGPDKQPHLESRIESWARTLTGPSDAGEAGEVQGVCQEGATRGTGMAQVGGRERMASRSRKKLIAEGLGERKSGQGAGLPVFHVHGDGSREGNPGRGVFLLSSVSDPSAHSGAYGVRVEKIWPEADQDVYDLTVQDAHCFMTGAGVFAHNCADALVYAMRRYLPEKDGKSSHSSPEDLNKKRIALYSGMGVW